MSKKNMLAYSLSRRRFMGTSAGGFAAAMLAGGALPGGFGKAVMAQDGGTEFHTAWPYLDPGAGGHFNSFVTNGILNSPNIYGDLMLIPSGLQYWADGSWMTLVAESWEFMHTGYAGATPAAQAESSSSASPAAASDAPPIGDMVAAIKSAPSDADTLQIKIRQGVKWSSGDDVTSQDYLDTFHIYKLQGNTMWDYLGEIEAVDDYTVNVYMKEPSTVVERYVIRASVRPSSIYGE